MIHIYERNIYTKDIIIESWDRITIANSKVKKELSFMAYFSAVITLDYFSFEMDSYGESIMLTL